MMTWIFFSPRFILSIKNTLKIETLWNSSDTINVNISTPDGVNEWVLQTKAYSNWHLVALCRTVIWRVVAQSRVRKDPPWRTPHDSGGLKVLYKYLEVNCSGDHAPVNAKASFMFYVCAGIILYWWIEMNVLFIKIFPQHHQSHAEMYICQSGTWRHTLHISGFSVLSVVRSSFLFLCSVYFSSATSLALLPPLFLC